MGESAVLKPLQGSGGRSVFLVSSDESPNLNQMIEAIGRDGYIVAQELLTEADKGDVRLFVMNGEPLRRGDSYAAFRRVNHGPDMRSNMHVGGESEVGQGHRCDARTGRGGPAQADRGRDVPRRPRHRRRQVDGGQRVQPGRARQLPEALRRRLRRSRDRGPRTQGRASEPTTGQGSTTPASPPYERPAGSSASGAGSPCRGPRRSRPGS